MESIIYMVGEHADDFADLMGVLTKTHASVRCYQSAESLLSRSGKTSGIAIIDQDLPGMDGISLLHLLLEDDSAIGSILTSHTADTRLAVKAMRLGAHDFLERPFVVDQVARFITRLKERQQRCRERQNAARILAARISLLSPRERTVFDAVTSGWTSKQIADNLSNSLRTIDTHRVAIKRKLGTACLSQWVRAAVVLEHGCARGELESALASKPQHSAKPGMNDARINGHRPEAR